MEDTYTKFSKQEMKSEIIRPVLITSISEAKTKHDDPYVILGISDGESEIQAKKFNDSSESFRKSGYRVDMVVKVKVAKETFNGIVSYKVTDVWNDNCGVAAEDLVKAPPVDIDEMYSKVCELLESTKTEGEFTPLACLALEIIGDNEARFKTSSASVFMHHNMRGGLLYHTYRMMLAADALCAVYTCLDRELLLCGTALHDIGKIWEYKTSPLGSAEYTKHGVLFGHLYMGASLIKERSQNGDYNKEKIMMLTHMILSHHGLAEWGAVKGPAFAEAYALHYIDNIDAKIYACEDLTASVQEGNISESKSHGMYNNLYRPTDTE